ncbi:glycosyltransferase family 4 protein [Sutcliffiella horikoshii]|uniref:Glycosyltransferase family 4 protein n=1 Tax=Sutcliffiella horikoshii TaxID=79883 RepID=A0A5D4T2P4_9BACI|nr:glycosyltransferase family 4 protein [Sutcliffiella horikoshii]TYS69843.1 glycosyltransferase family 4 protein [Sutcliffiella horikoshii]
MQKFININELEFDGKDRYLVITTAYPHPRQLYKNGFIHRRVKAYMERNLKVDIFVLHPAYTKSEMYLFEGVQVFRGTEEHLRSFLEFKAHCKALIHFATPKMVNAILEVRKEMPVITWIHGYETEAWHRRWFNFLDNPTSLRRILDMADNYYIEQLSFMNWFYQTDELNTTFVHISKWFKEHIAECDARAVSKRAAIIPNVIDEELFNYVEKPVEQRMNILSIRPYASRKYANDLSAEAVLELSKRPFFKRLNFEFYGEGPLFDEITNKIKQFPNVKIHKGFLSQNQIADVHKKNGIFLCPTRLDSQGVSMCEAMSSGLVPISTNITAIPEFVEHDYSGLLTKPESPVDIADAIERLYFNPDVFTRVSKTAAISIREKCSKDVVINSELELIKA